MPSRAAIARPSASVNGVPEAQRACAVEEASFARLSAQLALVSARLRCADQPELGSEERWILSLEATPRIREHLALLAPGEGRLDGELTLRFSASDQDGEPEPPTTPPAAGRPKLQRIK